MRAIDWTDLDAPLIELRHRGFGIEAAARRLGVSGNAVRRRIDVLELPSRTEQHGQRGRQQL